MYTNYTIPQDTEAMKECVHSSVIEKRDKKYLIDNLDSKEGRDVSYYIGSVLKAKRPVTVYKLPDTTSTVVKKYDTGAQIGIIYTWVVRDGFVWWSVDWFSGKHQGYVKADPSLFDAKVAENTSSGKQIEEKEKARIAEEEKNPFNQLTKGVTGITEGFGSLGSNFKYILYAVLVLAAIYVFFTFKKAL